ncbi:MAG: SDR family NAD(P)-dependent oxidoreductase [Flavobacteriales bacterium]|nr:SDR family NAD(P)-dependent oxidoreductase [Flavobacteriales bacterium]
MNKVILITGANAGIGKDTARQLALKPGTERIYLACRNPEKANAAKTELEERTGKSIFEIVIMDVSDPNSVKHAVDSISHPIDALIMNAGGMGGKEPEKLTKDGVTNMFAANMLGHVALVDLLIAQDKLKNVALYASSEAVRGIKKMGMRQPNLSSGSEDEIAGIMDGSYFGKKFDPMEAYGHVKYAATLWMTAMSRKHPNIKFISVSPVGTGGTSVMDDLNGIMRIMYKHVLMPYVMPMMGMAHSLETGAKRFVDSIENSQLESGLFYASKKSTITGPLVDQTPYFPALANTTHQDNTDVAVHRFLG